MCIGLSLAAPAPESDPNADPYLIYSNGLFGYGYPFSYGMTRPAVVMEKKVVAVADPEAEAEPETDPGRKLPYKVNRMSPKKKFEVEPEAKAEAEAEAEPERETNKIIRQQPLYNYNYNYPVYNYGFRYPYLFGK